MMSISNSKRILLSVVFVVIVSLSCNIQSSVYAKGGATPDGSHSLIEIFPGADSPALAEDIAAQIGAADTSYKPVSQDEFDTITTISLPTSDVKYIEGIEYCRNLKYLYLFGNLLTKDSIAPLEKVSTVTHLDLSENDITSDGLSKLSGLPLETLILNSSGLGSSNLTSLPPTITDLRLSDNDIGDIGAKAISSHFPLLTNLLLSDNNITDDGAVALANIANHSALTLDLRNEHIGSKGIKALIATGFKKLELDGQTLTASAITSGRAPVTHTVIVDKAHMKNTVISNNGRYSSADGTITWSAANKDGTYTYTFNAEGYSGKVSVPFIYKPFVYKVIFVDRSKNISVVSVEDESKVLPPPDPKRKGYIFTGWSLTQKRGDYFDFGTPITGDTKLYAIWTKNVDDENKQNDKKTVEDSDSNSDGDKSGNGSSNSSNSQVKRIGKSYNPLTGDDSFPKALIWIILISGAVLLIGAVVYLRKKTPSKHSL